MLKDKYMNHLGQIAQVRPQSAIEYAKSRKWIRVQTKRDNVAVYASPIEGSYTQVSIPRESSFDDFPQRMLEVIESFSRAEGRSFIEVMHDVMQPEADTIRFAWEGGEADSGSIGLSASVDLLEGAKRALLSSACSVLTPARHHPRMSRAEAETLVEASRLNHTEHGSFVLAVTCPVWAVDSQLTLTDDRPFTRKVTMTLMRSMDRLVKAIELDKEDDLYNDVIGDLPPVSANICDAILLMKPDRNDALRISASWAPVLPLTTSEVVPQMVRIRKDYVDAISRIRDRLRPQVAPKSNIMVGTVESLNGDAGDDGRRCGDVSLEILHEGELVRARVELDSTGSTV